MKLKIKKTTLSDKYKEMLSGEIGDAAKVFASLAESTCKFFQAASLNAVEYRDAPSIRKALSAAIGALEPIKNRRDANHHLHIAYELAYPYPHLDMNAPQLGFIEGQTKKTKLFRPNHETPPDDGWKHYQRPIEVSIEEMLDRLLHSLERAEARVEEAPHRKKGELPLSGNDKVFIRQLANHYESTTGRKASYTTDGPFHRVLCIVTRNAKEGMVYTGANLRAALKT